MATNAINQSVFDNSGKSASVVTAITPEVSSAVAKLKAPTMTTIKLRGRLRFISPLDVTFINTKTAAKNNRPIAK